MKRKITNKTYSLTKLLLNHSVSSFLGFFMTRTKVVAPKVIGEYKLKRIIANDLKSDTAVALYVGEKGKKAVVKVWQGKFPNYSYYSLKNEIDVYCTLNSTLKRLSTKIPAKFKKMRIPAVVMFSEEKGSLILMIEWIEGKTISGSSDKVKVDTYFKVTEFIAYLGRAMTPTERDFIATRTGISYIVLFPLLFVRALTLNLSDFSNLIRGIVIFMKGIPALLKNKKMLLVHRDLHFDNIMISGNKIYIIDLQFSVFTYQICELVTTLRYLWKQKGNESQPFLNLFLSKTNSFGEKQLFKPMLALSVVHALAGHNFSQKRLDDFKDLLNFGSSYYNK